MTECPCCGEPITTTTTRHCNPRHACPWPVHNCGALIDPSTGNHLRRQRDGSTVTCPKHT